MKKTLSTGSCCSPSKDTVAQGQARHGTFEWAASPTKPTSPSGPPHVGPRDALVQENAALFKQLEKTKAELANATAEVDSLNAKRAAERATYSKERAKLVSQVEMLDVELKATSGAAYSEQRRLTDALATCQAELAACSSRLQKTHAALGLTADKARALESSKGRLQIDLDGTLST